MSLSSFCQDPISPHIAGRRLIQIVLTTLRGLYLNQILWPSDSIEHKCPVCTSFHSRPPVLPAPHPTVLGAEGGSGKPHLT